MSTSGSESPGTESEQSSERLLQQDEFAAALNAEGYTDVLVVRRENGRDVLTDGRREIVDHLDQHGADIGSVSALARSLDRDKGAVSKDLHRLAELDVIEYEGEGEGTPKRPVLKHDTIVIEPVRY
ncbi:MAG: transcriptional regulator [Halobacteriales archaeon]